MSVTKENTELKFQFEEWHRDKREIRIITYEIDWVLTDFWLPIAVLFSIGAFIIASYCLWRLQ